VLNFCPQFSRDSSSQTTNRQMFNEAADSATKHP